MKRLVMVGVGPAQLRLLEGLAAGHVHASDPLLISGEPRYIHDTMLPGWLAGRHDEDVMSIDLARLAERAGCRFTEGGIRRIDAAAHRLELTDGRTEPWEVLSLSGDAIPCDARVPGAAEFALPIRPMARAREIPAAMTRVRQSIERRGIRIAVVGAGGRGFEVACAIRARLAREATPATIMVVDGEPHLLPDAPARTRPLAARALRRLNIGSALGARVSELSRRGLRLNSGAIIPADLVVWTIGAAPPQGLAGSGLALDERGFVESDDTLRSVSHPDVFVAGESAGAGLTLAENVAAYCSAAPAPRFRQYHAPSRRLVLLDCGDGRALVSYGALAREGRMAMRLKESLDRRFMSRYQRLAGAT